MEENTYPLFLKSDLYLEYTRTGGESPKPNPSDQSPSSGLAKPPPGYLPTLAEDVEWRWDKLFITVQIFSIWLLSSGSLKVHIPKRCTICKISCRFWKVWRSHLCTSPTVPRHYYRNLTRPVMVVDADGDFFYFVIGVKLLQT